MIEKGKITALQLGILLYPMILATAILVIPAVTGEWAQRDMVISPIWGALNGLFTAWISYKLQTYYPDQTIIQYSEQLVGKFLGKCIGLIFLLFLFHTAGIIVREYADLVVSSFLPKTPMLVVEAGMVLVCAMAIRGGIEVVARAAQIFFPFFIIFLFIMIILITPELQVENLFPLMEHGIKPSLLGAAVPQALFSEVSVAFTMLPFLRNQRKGFKWTIISILATMITLVLLNTVALLLMGENVVTHMVYPALIIARYISIADFFEHLEAILMALWVTGVFVKVSIFYYITVFGAAQWFQLANYRILVFPSGWLIILIGIWSTPNLMYLSDWIATIFPFYGTLFFTVLPLFLLIIAVMRKKWESKKGRMKT